MWAQCTILKKEDNEWKFEQQVKKYYLLHAQFRDLSAAKIGLMPRIHLYAPTA
jgi:hypothetical protein